MRGVLLKLIDYSGNDPLKQRKYNKIIELNSKLFIVLKVISEELYLVALCREAPQDNWQKYKTSKGCLYVNIKSFYTIDKSFCVESKDRLLFSQTTVNDIYSTHNEWKEALKKRKAEKKESEKKIGTSCPRIESMMIRKTHEKNEPPLHLQWAVKHPYQGGGFSGK